MVLYIIRHGAPDYQKDELLPEGREQAKAVGRRLECCGITEIHASPMGRARETAQPLADALGLPIIIEEWAHELGEESHTPFPDGVEKLMSKVPPTLYHAPENRTIGVEESLHTVGGLCENGFPDRYHFVASGLDGMLSKLGYARTPDGFYQPVSPNDRHVALFCHNGMTRVMLSHLFHVPYQFFAASVQQFFTGVTILHFGEEKTDDAIMPTLFTYGDLGHLHGNGKTVVHQYHGVRF